MTKLTRILQFLLAFILLLAGIAAVAITWQFNHSLPDYAGQMTMSGLSSSAHIVRDEYGVPHIFAANMNDAARALGYAHASERLFQMEMQRRAGQGRLSEILGSDMLGIDKFIRTLGLYHLAESSAEAMSPEAKAYFQAYADGVNAWLTTHPHGLPPEFMILRVTPEPWKTADSVVWGKLMGLQLSHNYKLEMLRAELAKKLTPTQMNVLFPLQIGSAPVTTSPHNIQKTEQETPDVMEQLGHFTGLNHGASNEWVIAGSHTESGKPILANDPHLELEAPILWYLARIVTPGFSVKGATVPGLPIVLLGQNDHIAWGFTTTGSDVQDLFIETVDPNNDDNYLVPGGSKPFDVRMEKIIVKNGFNVTLKVRSTRHGPVLSDVDEDMEVLAGKGKVVALAFTGLSERDLTSESLMHLNHAKDWASFLEALKLYQTPPQNVVFADDKGNIGFINPGIVPVRKASNGVTPVDGASGAFDWIGTIPFTQLPQIYNPAAGFIFNANNAITGPGQIYFLGLDWEEPYRAERLQQFFDTIPKHTLDSSAMMQADHVSLVAREFLPYLQNIKPTNERMTEAIALLKAWDGTMDKDRPEPLLFDAWLYELHQHMLVEKAGNPLKERGPYAATSLATILSSHASEWCGEALDKPAPNCDDIMTKALDDALSMLDHRESGDMKEWRWGHEQITILRHKFYSHIPFLKNRSDLSVASSGDFYTLDRGGSFVPDPDHPFERTHGGGFRGIYDLGDPAQSRFMITTGESGQINSPHYGDLVPLWNEVKSFTLTGSEEDLTKRGLPVLVMEPSASTPTAP